MRVVELQVNLVERDGTFSVMSGLHATARVVNKMGQITESIAGLFGINAFPREDWDCAIESVNSVTALSLHCYPRAVDDLLLGMVRCCEHGFEPTLTLKLSFHPAARETAHHDGARIHQWRRLPKNRATPVSPFFLAPKSTRRMISKHQELWSNLMTDVRCYWALFRDLSILHIAELVQCNASESRSSS